MREKDDCAPTLGLGRIKSGMFTPLRSPLVASSTKIVIVVVAVELALFTPERFSAFTESGNAMPHGIVAVLGVPATIIPASGMQI